MLQAAGFTGAAAGVNLARDVEQGRLDRLLVTPAPRWVLLSEHGPGGQRQVADPGDLRARGGARGGSALPRPRRAA